ncbi:C40 family peptidase [Aurantimonas sp. Leaf443]|uniref:C40 family peptidase n=1 Tax=Aurantimonas sp. Leaf443 TaxID=1736378 RepID=UPI000B1AF37A|nr:C40 family peptidase [Aurantimonas sp. Leaf443]
MGTDMLDRRLNAYRDDLADARLAGRVTAARFVEGEARRVRAPLAPLRRAPRDDAPLETQALMGEAVRVFETDGNGWCFAQLEDDAYVGYLPASALGPLGEAPTHVVRVNQTFLFPGPDIKRPPLATLPLGARLGIVGEASDRNATYALVAGGGAVVVQHLAGTGPSEADAVETALGFLGTPYLWGGKSALGIDCSGLVQVALGRAGIAAPRDADLQERDLGTPVPAGEAPRRGDLVFWPGHVGLMLDETRLLHANAFHMMTAIEPLAEASARMAARGVALRSVRRL